MDIKNLFEDLMKEMREVISKGHSIPLQVIPLDASGISQVSLPVYFRTDQEKYFILTMIGGMCAVQDCSDVVVMMEAAIRDLSLYTKEQREYINENYDTESPLCYPEGSPSRRECIFFIYLDLKNVKHKVLIQFYKHKDGVVVFEEDKDFVQEHYLSGCFQSAIIDSLIEGYTTQGDHVKNMLDRMKEEDEGFPSI